MDLYTQYYSRELKTSEPVPAELQPLGQPILLDRVSMVCTSNINNPLLEDWWMRSQAKGTYFVSSLLSCLSTVLQAY